MAQDRVKFTFDEIRSRNGTTFDGNWQTLGAALTRNVRILKIINDSNRDCDISFDGGTTQHDIAHDGSFVLYDMQANSNTDSRAVMATGTQISIRAPAGAGTGLIYAVCGGLEP